MRGLLWKYYLEDDVDGFRHALEESGVGSRTHTSKGNAGGQIATFSSSFGSPGLLSSPLPSRSRGELDLSRTPTSTYKSATRETPLTRAEVNRKDGKGMTVLHHAATSTSETAAQFALALIAHPLVDLYVQDSENGWTALHRAFYFGNILVARAILERDSADPLGQIGGAANALSASLFKVKDKEGNSPYDLLTATIHDRTLRSRTCGFRAQGASDAEDDDDEGSASAWNDGNDETTRKRIIKSVVDVDGDAVYTFGSNRNITLGFGNQDDRQYPEQIHLRRPEHLFVRFHREHIEQNAAQVEQSNALLAEKLRDGIHAATDFAHLPSVSRAQPTRYQDVQMSKFHSAVITSDPVSNLYLCGHGLGGRLGTGNEKTQFNFVCIEEFGGQHRKRIVAVALGQDHTLAVADSGELFAWGSNAYGQLGFGAPKANTKPEDAKLLTPKQIFGVLKKEVLVGVAASRIHSVAHTSTALFTFGKNEGQLGIVDAHAGSLELQPTPRRVATSNFSCGIHSVSAIDRATVVLLENHQVYVFANFGITKLSFPLDGFTNYFLKSATRYDDSPNTICKVTSGGDTICALTSAGEVFNVTVDQKFDPSSSSTVSTTNPTKIKNALSTPSRIWSLKKTHMSARDVGVDADGSVILTTESGSVWRRVRRTVAPGQRGADLSKKRSKDFKFSRVPALTRITAVRASASGAYCAIRQDCNVTRTEMEVSDRALWKDIADLLPFKNFVLSEEDNMNPPPEFWTKPSALTKLCSSMSQSRDLERDVASTLRQRPNQQASQYDCLVTTTSSDLQIPAHQFVLSGRSRVLRDALHNFRQTGSWSSELVSISRNSASRVVLAFNSLDFLTLSEYILYCYTDHFIGFWLLARRAPALAFRYRQVRSEVMRLAARLDMRNLESAARRMASTTEACLDKDMQLATMDLNFFNTGDALLQLRDAEVSVHSDLMSKRCPFFEGLFRGRAGGKWLADRRDQLDEGDGVVTIDMMHVDLHVFQLVLRYVYGDVGEEIFDDIVANDQDEFLDLVLDVLSVANELMLDRLSEICQKVLGRYVNVRNICSLLNAVGPSSVGEFKRVGLEYLCLNLEAVLTNHLIDELEEDLLYELDEVVRENQLASLPFAKSGRAELELLERNPELAALLDRDRQAKLDAVLFQAKYTDLDIPLGTSIEHWDENHASTARSRHRARARRSTSSTAPSTPALKALASPGETSRSNFPSPTLRLSPRILSNGNDFGTSLNALSNLDMHLPPSAMEGETTIPMPKPGESILHHQSPDLKKNVQVRPTPGAGTPSAEAASSSPWGAAPMTTGKLDIGSVISQVSASRKSNISLGLASQQPLEERNPGSFNSRMSQKERRKLQQRQISNPSPASSQPLGSSPTLKSPWQTVEQAPKGARSPRTPAVGDFSSPPPSSVPQKIPTAPQLTMRQTVSRAPSNSRDESATASSPQTPQQKTQQARSTPASQQRPKSSSSASTIPSKASKPVEIQSIRHHARPAAETSPAFFMHQSMADILSHEEAQKLSIKEAAAKRSLQEIQEEQAFQEWWDQESRRVMDEEAAAAAVVPKGASTRGRGRSGPLRGTGRSRRGRGKEKAEAAE